MNKLPKRFRTDSRVVDRPVDENFSIFFDKEFLEDNDMLGFEKDYVWPSGDGQSILDSLKYHASNHRLNLDNSDSPSSAQRDLVVSVLEDAYKPAMVGVKFETEYTIDTFMSDLRDVDMQATPGFPWNASYSTNSDFLMKDGELNLQNVYQLYLTVKDRLETLASCPVSDDINLFIKNEPHKKTKQETGAWRLISAVGLTDCMVDRYLFGPFFNACYTSFGVTQTPNKAGWTPFKGGYRYFVKKWKKMAKLLLADKKSWDWTMLAWIVQVLTELMIRFCGTDAKRIAQTRNRMLALFTYCTYSVGGKVRFSQVFTGVMKSGCLGTIVWNGVAQVALHILASLRGGFPMFPLPDSMGDDTVQAAMKDVEGYMKELNRAGCIAREYHVVDLEKGDSVEFAGTLMTERESRPSYLKKHLIMLLYSSDFKKESLESYSFLYTFVPDMFNRIQGWSSFIGGTNYSRSYLTNWYNGRT